MDEKEKIKNKITEVNFDHVGFEYMRPMAHKLFVVQKSKQKIVEIVGNEGRRIGGERKMKRIQTGLRLFKRLMIEIFHNP